MPACVIVKLWLATTTIAVRCAGDVLAATVNCTLPSARPSRALSVTKVSLDVANHVHSAPAVTLIVPVPPPAGTLVPVAVAEYEQGGGAFGGAAPTWIPEVSGVAPPQSLMCAPGDQFRAAVVIGPENRLSAVHPFWRIVDRVPLKFPFSRVPVSTPVRVPAKPVLFTNVPVRLSPSAAPPVVAAVAPATTAPPGRLNNREMSQGTWMNRAFLLGGLTGTSVTTDGLVGASPQPVRCVSSIARRHSGR